MTFPSKEIGETGKERYETLDILKREEEAFIKIKGPEDVYRLKNDENLIMIATGEIKDGESGIIWMITYNSSKFSVIKEEEIQANAEMKHVKIRLIC